MVQCKAHTTAGNPCRKHAIAGASVCRSHGGAAPQVKAKALERLLKAADPAAKTLVDISKKGDAADRDRIRASEAILDRAGIPKRAEFDVDAKFSLIDEVRRVIHDTGDEEE